MVIVCNSGNLYFLKKVHLTKKLKICEYVVRVVFLLFATNQEQGLAIMLGIIQYTVFLIEKLFLNIYINNPVSLFFTFSLVIITSKVKNSVINLCAMILIAVVCIFGLFGQWLISLYPNVSFLYTSLGKYGILSFNNYKSIIVYLIFFL